VHFPRLFAQSDGTQFGLLFDSLLGFGSGGLSLRFLAQLQLGTLPRLLALLSFGGRLAFLGFRSSLALLCFLNLLSPLGSNSLTLFVVSVTL
jgi:hypothetical protein